MCSELSLNETLLPLTNMSNKEHKILTHTQNYSPKLFTAVIEEIFKKADLDKGINIDGERLQNLRFADDVALVTKTTKEMEEHLNKLNTESKKCGLKIYKGKTKFRTNFETDEEIKIENEKLEKVESYNYLGQITTTNRKSDDEIKERIRKSWSCFGKNTG